MVQDYLRNEIAYTLRKSYDCIFTFKSSIFTSPSNPSIRSTLNEFRIMGYSIIAIGPYQEEYKSNMKNNKSIC
jgi:hypothetical protein